MTYWQDSHRTLYNHDCRSMPELADNSIQMVVTSPPYWGLRKYAGEQDLIWGGKTDCPHFWYPAPPGRSRGINDAGSNPKQGQEAAAFSAIPSNFCSLCGAWRGSFGLEPTPEMYVAHTIEILREVRRVLRKDGVVFWNIADSYAGSWGNSGSRAGGQREKNVDKFDRPGYDNHTERPASSYAHPVIKPKDMCLIPFRVAIAAQEDGWWVRSVIIWNKPNPMPESVTDRPTESHEYILMLTKSAKYYWDAEAVREKSTEPLRERERPNGESAVDSKERGFDSYCGNTGNRNLRSVWTFPTQPYRGAHFATYPEKLVEICVKAATPEYGCCSKCGRPWERVIERTGHINKREPAHAPNNCPTKTDSTGWAPVTAATDKWEPACKCQDATTVPSTVLDPFSGSGTTLQVSAELNRRAVGYELSEEYCQLAIKRNHQGVIL